MENARSFPGRLAGGLLLVLAGTLLQPITLTGQTTPPPAQAAAPASAPMPAELQSQLHKLEEALRASQAAADAKSAAKALNQIGALYSRTSDYGDALDAYNQALTAARSAKDTTEETAALNGMGGCYRDQSQNQKALDLFQQALDLATASGDEKGQATALNGIGWVDNNTGQNRKALEFHDRALLLARKVGDSNLEATILRRAGVVYFILGEKQKALDSYNQALSIFRQTGDQDGEAGTLNNIGVVYLAMGEKQKALESYLLALPISHQAGDRAFETRILNNIGNLYLALGERQKALQYYNSALPIAQLVGNRTFEATTLNNLGNAHSILGEKQKALDEYNRALPILRVTGNRPGEAEMLRNIGQVYNGLGEKQKALDCYNQALTIQREVGDRRGEAETLRQTGLVYNDLGERQKALEYYDRTLPIQRDTGNHDGEAWTLNDIGLVYADLGEKQKALEYYDRALPIFRLAENSAGEAMALNNIGNIYNNLGEIQKALDYYNQSLPVIVRAGDRDGEGSTLNNIGVTYYDLGEKQKALDYLNRALTIRANARERRGEAETLVNIGNVYYIAEERQQSLEFYNRALPILRQVGDREGEAMALNNTCAIYYRGGENQKALEYCNQALPLASAVSDPILEALVFRNQMHNLTAAQPALAIFYGKQAVNLLQQVRSNIQGLDKALQKSFLASRDSYYHDLADLLIAQGRLPEAQQALDLLKQQEYSDYTRGSAADTLSPLTLTPAERQAAEDYQKSTAQLVSLGEQWAVLKKIGSRTPEQEKQYQQLSDRLNGASKELNDYYARLYVLFGKNGDANKQVADVKGNVSLLKQTIAKMPHTVALYTLVGKDRTSLIVITGSAAVAREYAIPEEELNKKVAAFEQVLRTPASDPKPMAQELYKILIAPVKTDLDQAEAQTLVWSLDGVLRYVPIAALYDGKQYVVEKYNTVTITPASIAHLGEKPDVSNLSAAAMGISRQYEEGLPALPAVVGELNDVVKDAQAQTVHGVLPGTILLDGQFTEKAMETQLGGQHTVVHIASHFVFKPGDDSQSYLLLAGQQQGSTAFHLTVAGFRDNQKLSLEDTDLLTLSACETGMSGNASDGREVDGLGTTAQLKGAKAVISSLWEVNDASTGMLMGDFYKRWADGGGRVTKVEALRQAQLDLLQGSVQPDSGAGARGIGLANVDVPAGFRHPYYWAPFVLMGNWR
ncbi:MAG: tetratricopeptide repeat protein [Terracidiphilus sp.]|jgi:CHAT domain-containing protein/Tfp pilus assembly protein PilF